MQPSSRSFHRHVSLSPQSLYLRVLSHLYRLLLVQALFSIYSCLYSLLSRRPLWHLYPHSARRSNTLPSSLYPRSILPAGCLFFGTTQILKLPSPSVKSSSLVSNEIGSITFLSCQSCSPYAILFSFFSDASPVGSFAPFLWDLCPSYTDF